MVPATSTRGQRISGLDVVGYGLGGDQPRHRVGVVFAAFIIGTARQPEATVRLQGVVFIAMAMSEALAIFGLILAFISVG